MKSVVVYRPSEKKLGDVTLVGFRVLCTQGEDYVDEIPKAVQKLLDRTHEIDFVEEEDHFYGAFMVDACEPAYDGYWVGKRVGRVGEIPHGMEVLTVPAQTYATIPFKGPNHRIMTAYQELHEWIDKNQYERMLNKWHLERYRVNSAEDITQVDVELYDTIR
ncbi:GyrI-like domain-containing protein [Halobacillus litoralis]|uniref:GyrI-like domain-containing protein n=1 Tax=Halobacillus litoralis TaxID=45668 RepID=UPI001CD80A00|nr:GyrI-like domain-containing protein [Halobacillus litoralis]MCA0970232.1 GyrI-like domain-containing protein [Halobacillus litoralis]